MKRLIFLVLICLLVGGVCAFVDQYPVQNTSTYVKATSEYNTLTRSPHFATNTSLSLIGSADGNTWLSGEVAGANQRFHIDLGSAKNITHVYYENWHGDGLNTNRGAHNFTMYGSNTSGSFADTTYGTDTGWTALSPTALGFDQHSTSDAPDPKYFNVTGGGSYRYYAFKISNNWGDATYLGLRRIVLQSDSPTIPTLSADFHADDTTPALLQSVSFTDDSTGTPDSWNWTFNDGNFSSLQNPTHAFPSVGSYSINLSVNTTTEQSWMNKSNYITVHDLEGFNQQDLTLSPQSTLTVTFVDKDTLLPIPQVLVIDSNNYNETTTVGVFQHDYTYQTVVLYLSSSGYDSKSVSYVMDTNRTETVQLTKSTTAANQNTWYTPHQVRFRILDSYGAPITNLEVNASATANTLPSDNDLQLIYGINPEAANEMLNGTLLMHGPTGSDGAVVFTMLGSIGYNLNMNNPTRGGLFTTYVMPIDSQYNVWVNTSTIPGTNPDDSVYLAVQNTSLWFAEPNVSYIRLGVNYTDRSGKTSNVKWYVTFGNNKTVLYSKDLGNPGTGMVTDWRDYKNIRGANFVWNYSATRLK